ncbi:hypothetical protein SOM61_25720 [Massilia sp. CFBP9012]|uniref:hypothetical protein n=1 Tax=Massilia sp. CFBP9012 TaxID=3096531 RepID=UPI002A6B6E61|nr:hypothetical protein [Massilia sp. CFBP9012]MDY0978367.1 hypothetical protein [Massilia sp. CFBP9012]
MMTKPLMTLTARLDVNQVDDGIDWLFTDLDSAIGSDRTRENPHWNRDIEFDANQDFRIAITASDKDNTGLESIEVIDCCLITRPQIICCGPGLRTRYAPPSPFASVDGKERGALVRIDPSAFIPLATSNDSPEKIRKITLLWDNHLAVGNINGFWEISFYLTVLIKRAQKEAAQLRVFYFDPEGEISNGSDPP